MVWVIGCAYIGLLCALVLATFGRGEPMRRTALVLLGVMLAAYAFSFAFGGGMYYSLYMIGVNALACWAIVKRPAARWQSVIGWSLILQIGTDSGSVAAQLHYGSSDAVFVYWATVILAYAQLFMLGGWWLSERAAGLAGYRANHQVPSPARRGGVA